MQPQPRLLVVDDTPLNIKLLDGILSPRGYTVVPATSGQEALDLVARNCPDLILLDILMPGMDGYEVCCRLRENPDTCLLPVIMITASGNQEKVRAIEAALTTSSLSRSTRRSCSRESGHCCGSSSTTT